MNISKELIINCFYKEHLKVKDIAKIVNASSSYITKIIKEDKRYFEEKNYRKKNSKEKRKIAQNQFIKSKREKQKLDDNFTFMEEQHRQASYELSK